MSNNILLLFNPIAGKGRSQAAIQTLESCLKETGFRTFSAGASDYIQNLHKAQPLTNFQAAVIAGGDGTIRSLLPLISNSEVPVYNIPTGNESLFAREFYMKNNVSQIISLLEQKSYKTCFVPETNQMPFFSMVSVGFDSEVVRAIAENRTGAIGHRGYVLPTLKTSFSHKAPITSLSVDGKKVISSEPGFTIVANCKQYALSMPFLPEANCESEELVARFFPYKGLPGYLLFNIRILLGQKDLPGSKFFRGEKFLIETQSPFPAQVDGDYLGNTPIELKTTENTIRVLAT
jgi:diacylglycerol kinase (ATP)